jgi:Trypsin-co-occurring domain 2
MSDQPKIPLAEAIRALREELAQAVREGQDEEVRFQVGPVDLEFQVEISKEASGRAGIAFWLITVGGGSSRSSTTAHTVKINLQPVDPEGNPVQVSQLVTSKPD